MNALGTFAPQGKFIFGQGKRWLADLTDDHLALEPIAGTKTAGWLVGHLSVTGDFGRRICGLTPMCPKEWRAIFNPGTFPSLDRSIYPPMAELRDMMAFYKTPTGQKSLKAMPQVMADVFAMIMPKMQGLQVQVMDAFNAVLRQRGINL